ncbi:UNKNOWN [Stylonychia lemnae]|uniref:Uncharacterized protein n=1 Tax=Stylonychia lemnae TaxID=5949 RepID=A0A078B3J8_STYLE|nr:UNKNOWN [Stylonychia lemnae]|eukprot:CDW88078.1 UNKNOWN [Stylonychia lemnae]
MCDDRILYCRECSLLTVPGTNINIHNHPPIYVADACTKIAYQSQQGKEKAQELVSKANEFFNTYKIVLEWLDNKLRGNGGDNLFNPQNYFHGQNQSMMHDFNMLTELLEKINQTNEYIESKAIELKIIDIINKKNLVNCQSEDVKKYQYLGNVTFDEVWQQYYSLFFQDQQFNLNINQLDLDNFKLLTYLKEKISAQKIEFLEERVKTMERMLTTKFEKLNSILENQFGLDKID